MTIAEFKEWFRNVAQYVEGANEDDPEGLVKQSIIEELEDAITVLRDGL